MTATVELFFADPESRRQYRVFRRIPLPMPAGEARSMYRTLRGERVGVWEARRQVIMVAATYGVRP